MSVLKIKATMNEQQQPLMENDCEIRTPGEIVELNERHRACVEEERNAALSKDRALVSEYISEHRTSIVATMRRELVQRINTIGVTAHSPLNFHVNIGNCVVTPFPFVYSAERTILMRALLRRVFCEDVAPVFAARGWTVDVVSYEGFSMNISVVAAVATTL
jgi:hypothetical protein